MTLLRSVFIIQIFLMAPVFVFFLATPAHLGTLLLVGALLPVGAVTVLIAAWHGIRYPERRRLALAMLVTSSVCIGTPFVLETTSTGPVPPAQLVLAAVALLVVASMVLLARSSSWAREGGFAKSPFNLWLLQAMGVAFALLWFPAIGWLASVPIRERLSKLDIDTVVSATVVYYLPVSAIALCLSLFCLVYAPVGLFRNPVSRSVHVVQIVLALLLLASLAAGSVVVGIFMFNPG